MSAWEFVSKYKMPLVAVAGVAALAGAFLLGRYTGPTKTFTKTEVQVVEKEVVRIETQYVERIVKAKAVARDVHRETTTTTAPDGTRVVKTVVDDKTKTNESSSREALTSSSSQVELDKSMTTTNVKVVEAARPDWHLGLQLGAGLALPATPQVAIDVSAERRIVGPFWLGLGAQLQLGVVPTVVPRGFTVGIRAGVEF